MDQPSKKERIRATARLKAFGRKKGVKTTPRVLNSKEKRALRMEGEIGTAMRLYEELRHQDCKNAEELIQQIYDLQGDRLASSAIVPRFSRVYQCCAKKGTEAQLQRLIDIYKGRLAEMATAPYCNQLVLALLNHARPHQREPLFEELVENAKGMVTSRYGQRVLQRVYSHSQPHVRRRILINAFDAAKLRGASEGYKLSIKQIWQANPAMRGACAKVLGHILERCVERGLVESQIVQELLELSFRYCKYDANMTLLPDLLKALVHICHTDPGARLTECCLRYASPADRAVVLGTFTRSLEDMATGPYSSLLLCTIFDLVDDTKTVRTAALAELGECADTMLTDPNAARILLHLLTPQRSRKVTVASLRPWVLKLCHDERRVWDTMQVVDTLHPRTGEVTLKPVQTCTTPWATKHAAALTTLLPKIQATLAKSPSKYAGDPVARPILEELVQYATQVPAALKGGYDVPPKLLTLVRQALADTPAPAKTAPGRRGPKEPTAPAAPPPKRGAPNTAEPLSEGSPPAKRQKKRRRGAEAGERATPSPSPGTSAKPTSPPVKAASTPTKAAILSQPKTPKMKKRKAGGPTRPATPA